MPYNFALFAAGAIAILTGIVHTALGETHIICKIAFPSRPLAILSRGILWVSGAAWVAAGILFFALALTGPSPLAPPIIITQSVVLGIGAVGNFQATKGRHPGWVLLAMSIGLALYALLAGM